MAHDHEEHHHGHSHTPTSFGRSFLIAASLNMVFIVAEVIYGIQANSLALLADAGHNFSDVIGLLLAWGAYYLSKRAPSQRYTYGLRSTSIMAAFLNALLLMIAIGGIAWEAIQRFSAHEPIAGSTVMWVAGLGILINGFTAWLFSKGQNDLNIKAAFLHLAADALVSVGVVIAGFIMLRTGWLWLDPVVSLAICAVIVWGTWGLLKDSVNLSLHAVPTGVDLQKVKTYLAGLPNVKEVHDLHVWGMSTTEVALSAHLLIPGAHPGDEFLRKLADSLHDDYGIEHSTVQIEIGDGTHECALASDEKV